MGRRLQRPQLGGRVRNKIAPKDAQSRHGGRGRGRGSGGRQQGTEEHKDRQQRKRIRLNKLGSIE